MKRLLLVSLVFSTACGTMRLQVTGPYRSSQGNGFVTHERSYKVGGGLPWWCGLTAVVYGGACWAYVALPFASAKEKAVRDTVTALNTKLGASDVVLEMPEIKRISWSSAEPYFSAE